MADSFEEMMLKMTVDERFSKRDVAYMLLRIGRINFLIEWMKFDNTELDAALKICDVLKHIYAEIEAEKCSKKSRNKTQNAA